ncbi:MAG: PEP-CTERM sorting domain-containing protein [Verrucomicrobia bacterium]|nr:PEP-CTERM sorting domain-containing protein [Verrucomicrobiota bacterium]
MVNFQGGWCDAANVQLRIDDITVVPEPSTYAALAGVLVFGLAVWTRRRRR